MIIQQNEILGVILAGGQHRRMGNTPKWQLTLGDKPILDHIIERLAPQVSQIIINGNHPALAKFNLPVINDIKSDQGPLGGIYSCLLYAQKNNYSWIATTPCDSPFLPEDWVLTLYQTIHENNSLASTIFAHGHHHPVFSLWSTSLIEPLQNWLENEHNRSLNQWIRHIKPNISIVDMSYLPEHVFFNVNTPNDLETAKTLIGKQN